MFEAQPIICELYRKAFVESQKSFKQVLLVQRKTLLDKPFGRVVMRKENVVHVHPNTALESRQDLEKLVADIAAKLHSMTGINEQNVIRFETREEIDVD